MNQKKKTFAKLKATQEHAQSVLSQMNSRERHQFIFTLEGKPTQEAKPYLLVLIRDKDNLVRGLATEYLFDYVDEVDLDILTEMLMKDPDSLVRTNAAYCLSGLKSTQAISALISSLTTDHSWLVRSWAAQSIGDIGDSELLPFLLWYMRKTRSSHVHLGLCYASYKLGHKPSLEPLAAYLLHEDYLIRGAAASSLVYLKDQLSLEEFTDVVLPAFRESLEMDDNVNIRNAYSELEQVAEERQAQRE